MAVATHSPSASVIVVKALMTSAWGHLIDRRGAKLVFLTTMLFVAVVPLPWFFANGLGMVILAQMWSGTSWYGYEVGYFSMLLEKSTRKTRPIVFAGQSVFVVSIAGRPVVSLGAPFMLASIGRSSAMVWSRMGLRPFGLRSKRGFSMRPVLPVEEDAPGDITPGSDPVEESTGAGSRG
ncbi:MAG: hypothetical protein OEO79_12955 [Gemmatimonadota bacterium]|nr:hypothetical protein [Gemmatimonadota bacterium]